MSTPLRKKRGHSVIWGVLALMMIGLGGYGVTNFSQGVTDLGTVGDRKISVNDYHRALQSEMASLSNQVGQQLTFEQAQQMGLDRQVQATLVAAAALEGEAARLGISIGDVQIKDRIMAAPGFQGPDGKFNRDAYAEFLRQQGLNEAQFERKLRDEGARTILQGAVVTGVEAPEDIAARIAAWRAETRSFTFAELIPSDLPAPVPAPTADEIKAWYDAHNASYMRPETRKITYVWLSPDDMKDQVQVDEKTLKDAYAARKSDFVVPEKRMVSRLVYPTADEAAKAKARLDAKEASFEDLVRERGLAPADVDLGEVTKEDLGPAGDAVFALKEPAVIGPLDSDLGPALFSMNGILDAQITTFDEARDELRNEVAIDRARRLVSDKAGQIEDALASGASLADVAKDEGMTLGHIDFNSESEGGISGYEAFRKAALAATPDAFPTLTALDDGGVFALQLDKIDPAALKPLDEVKDKVIADWTADETHKHLLTLAQEQIAELDNGATLDKLGLVTTHLEDFARDGFVQDADPAVGKEVFAMTAGDHKVVDAGGKVYLLSLDSVTPADMASEQVRALRDKIRASLSQSTGRDLFDAFTRAVESTQKVTLDQAAINAVDAQMR
ncbi:MAG: SurA N-terminal domain-containing protein [Proteobacteria bacterium]|nr:SurA N-terminal domain-containing protein [Pseudomonadota bacterium]MBS0574093.1 SurA N-terminal domain-containing protein [Pseudomonadota bacterium]